MGLKENDRADLVEHLEELRTRIIRSIVYVMVLTGGAWAFYDRFLGVLLAPAQAALREAAGTMQWMSPVEAFWTRFQVSVVVALIVGAPLLLWEAWGFVAPGLTRRERRAVLPLLPVSGMLALGGVVLCYVMSHRIFRVMIGFGPANMEANLRLQYTVMFTAKFYLAFAAAFQLPLVVVGLVRTGVVSADSLARRRREAIVVILIVTAVLTPTPDAFTLALLAVPLVLLFEGTLWVVRVMERRRRKEAERYDEDLGSEAE